jgi:hypothetical protein
MGGGDSVASRSPRHAAASAAGMRLSGAMYIRYVSAAASGSDNTPNTPDTWRNTHVDESTR